jgi:uncharacterized protein
MYARPFIDSLDFAGNGREISGEVPVAELARLQDVLESPQGILSYAVRGGVDNQGSHYLDIGVTGRCSLLCQRCLKGLDYQVQIDTRLLLREQPSLDAMGDEEEEFDSILADTHLDVLNMLEEEIVLSLPIAPKHETGACQAAGGENRQEDKQHPFAVLEKLKRN